MHLHFAGGSKWAIVPSTGKTGNDQRETGVSLLLQLKYWNLSDMTTFYRMLSKCFTSTCSINSCRFQKDPTWSETGDRYLLKLFRDHLFHLRFAPFLKACMEGTDPWQNDLLTLALKWPRTLISGSVISKKNTFVTVNAKLQLVFGETVFSLWQSVCNKWRTSAVRWI